jgi:ABC-2 type transport system permease protein
VRALWRQFVVSIRLQLRNPSALAYSYAIPLVFLAAFWAIYRHDSPPLVRHLGQLLTITALSGACFALPAWLVSDRERGVWRQYRLAPVSGAVHLGGMLGASYLLLLSAGALQIAAAAAIGTPLPADLFQLWIAFTLTCAAFLGIGLLITMIGDTVPAAQALGQAVFLPMLILGGVAVPLANLPDWVQQIAAALPGRYAVDAINGALAGGGFDRLVPNAAALAAMAAGSGIASMAIFRWEARQRIGVFRASVPVGLVIVSWFAVGVAVKRDAPREVVAVPTSTESKAAIAPPALSGVEGSAVEGPALSKAEGTKVAGNPVAGPAPVQRTWRDATMDDIDVNLVFVGLPPDHGVVTPITAEYRKREDVECIRTALPAWPPAGVDDVVQRVRNVLLLAAVADVLQLEIEHDVPIVAFDHLQQKIPKDQLIKVLYWVATHPAEGDLNALDQLAAACLSVQPPEDADQLRERISIYATKLLGRITGKIKSVAGGL